MAIVGRAIRPIMAKMVKMGVMARPIMAISLTFIGVPGKYGRNADHLWKTVLKKIHPTEFYGQNKKMCEKWPFLGDFLCKKFTSNHGFVPYLNGFKIS